MHGEFGAKVLVAAGGLDGIDVAHEIGYGDVGRGELFDEAVFGPEPGDWRGFSVACDEVVRELADRGVGVVASLGAGNIWHVWIEQRRECAEDPRLGLSTETEEDEVVAREDGVDDLGDDGVFVADDAWKERGGGIFFSAGAGLKPADQVFPQLILDTASKAFWSVFAGA